MDGLIMSLGEVEDIVRDGGKEPVVDAGVGRASLLRDIDVWAKDKLAAQGEEEGRPTSEVGALQLEGVWGDGEDCRGQGRPGGVRGEGARGGAGGWQGRLALPAGVEGGRGGRHGPRWAVLQREERD